MESLAGDLFGGTALDESTLQSLDEIFPGPDAAAPEVNAW
jgi:hypothetical protein